MIESAESVKLGFAVKASFKRFLQGGFGVTAQHWPQSIYYTVAEEVKHATQGLFLLNLQLAVIK